MADPQPKPAVEGETTKRVSTIPAGTKVLTSGTSVVAQEGGIKPAGAGGDQEPSTGFSKGVIPPPPTGDQMAVDPGPTEPPQMRREPSPQGTADAFADEPGLDAEDDMAMKTGEAGVAEGLGQGFDYEQIIEEGESRAIEVMESPSALNRIRSANIETLDWKDKLAVALISIAGGAVIGEGVGLGATFGGLAGGAAGMGELKQRQDEERKQAMELEQIQAKATGAAGKKRLQSKAVEFLDSGEKGFAAFDPGSGKYYDSQGNDISGNVRPIDQNRIHVDKESGRVFDLSRAHEGIYTEIFPAKKGPEGEAVLVQPPPQSLPKPQPDEPGTVVPAYPPSDQAPGTTGPMYPEEPPDGDYTIPGSADTTGPVQIAPPRPGGRAGGTEAFAGRLNGAGILIKEPEVLQEAEKNASVQSMLSELEKLQRQRDKTKGITNARLDRQISDKKKTLQAELDILAQRKREDEKRTKEREEARRDFEYRERFKLQMSGKPLKKDGTPLNTNEVNTVNDLSKKTGNMVFIKSFLDSENAQFKKALKAGQKDQAIAIGRNMAKVFNSPLGADAVGRDEAKMVTGFVELKFGNFTEPGSIFGRDLEEFGRQVDARSTSMGVTIRGLKGQISNITQAKPLLLPTVGTRADFDLLPVSTKNKKSYYISNRDGLKYEKTSPTGSTPVVE